MEERQKPQHLRGKRCQAWGNLPFPEAGDSCPEVYDRLRLAYDQYCQIGGYPKVVEAYLERRDILEAQKELVRIIQIFLEESMRYFKDITDISVFTNIFLSICRILLREKKGMEEDSVSEELQKLVTKNFIEIDFLDFKPGRRCFFMDPGVAAYYLNRVGTTEAAVNGTLNENYVFINLLKRQDFPEEITFGEHRSLFSLGRIETQVN